MKKTRTLLYAGVVVVAFALFGGSATVGQGGVDLESSQTDRAVARQTDEPSDVVLDLGRQVARLRQRLQRKSVPQNIRRNPFLLIPEERPAESLSVPRPMREIPHTGTEHIEREDGDRPTFSFIGVALEGDRRTAIFLMEDGQVVIVGVGGALEHQYRVAGIEEAAVTIFDSNGTVRRHELR